MRLPQTVNLNSVASTGFLQSALLSVNRSPMLSNKIGHRTLVFLTPSSSVAWDAFSFSASLPELSRSSLRRRSWSARAEVTFARSAEWLSRRAARLASAAASRSADCFWKSSRSLPASRAASSAALCKSAWRVFAASSAWDDQPASSFLRVSSCSLFIAANFSSEAVLAPASASSCFACRSLARSS
ncbi:hypothetical protein KC316_g43 [Hortaea werneckii]|nr:hypothetical protein KC316_g43 [Hortaea werneckii]